MPESDLLLTRHIAAALTAAWHATSETQSATGTHDAAFLAGARTALARVERLEAENRRLRSGAHGTGVGQKIMSVGDA